MNESIMQWYRETLRLIEVTRTYNDNDEGVNKMTEEWQSAIESMEQVCPGLRKQYEREKKIQESFTEEQIDFICYKIGEWYMQWKHGIADYELKTHRLGYAKERLKTMICGD